MKLTDLKIGTQLRFGFGLLMLFITVLAAISYINTNRIDAQIEVMYSHPFKVRSALGALNADILKIRVGARDLMLAKSSEERHAAVLMMEVSAANAHRHFKILDDQYLGPRKDVEDAYAAFVTWNTGREEVVKLALAGNIEEVKDSINPTGTVGLYRDDMLAKIRKIDEYAVNKTDSLYANANELHDKLNRQMLLLIGVILPLSFLIYYILLRNIRKPLNELTDAARNFSDGDMDARSSYEASNEFGQLSDSFNALADSVQSNSVLDKKIASFAELMLSEYDAKKFFRSTLNELAAYTGSQMVAVYLLSSDKKTFECFDSVGVDENARKTFSADSFEGEFGPALSSRKVQHIKNISDETRFVFHTVSGTFVPHEIITLPLLAGNEVIAVISLATVDSYGMQSVLLIDNILVTLCARVEGIMAYHKMKDFSEKLEAQNSELEAQKVEMTSQAAELITQNTELEMQKKQLDEASRLKTNFLSNMSHELRTPLNSVIALSGVLGRRLARQIPEEEYSYLEVIERNGKLLLSLINDILDIARIEAGHEEVEIATFDVNSLIAEIVRMIHPQAELNNIELLHTDGETKLPVSSDAVKCRHILQNLIGNAVKFTEQGSVEISARQNIDNIEITVTDTGIGIDENHLPHIFDEFRQADGSTSRRFGGTGLGLAIAKRFAGLIGGGIAVSSTPGKGSVFALTLPLHFAAESSAIEVESTTDFKYAIKQAPHRPVSELSVKTVLLVEDSEPAIVQLRDILEEDGCRILVARNGSEALEIIAHTIPDAMVLDLMMPGIDGFEVLKTIRNADRSAHIPVLILTAKHITKEDLKMLKRNNVHQLIQKGDVNRIELQRAVAAMVSSPQVEIVTPHFKPQQIEGKPLVLVVEDNPDNMITVRALLKENYTLIEAVDGTEGIEMAGTHTPHLILMDIALPDVDGIEAFRIIRNDVRLMHIPIIALTASAMLSDREVILAHGFDAYVAKPIDETILFKSMKEVLYGR